MLTILFKLLKIILKVFIKTNLVCAVLCVQKRVANTNTIHFFINISMVISYPTNYCFLNLSVSIFKDKPSLCSSLRTKKIYQ